jgi:MFS family permease
MNKGTAIVFVVLLGCVSLFGDVTYEGARSIVGPYLGTLGATGTIIGIAAGAGELVGYGIRLASGFLTDKSKQYWPLTIAGYVINLAAVPLLALAGNWQIAVALVICERAGKGIRTPARDAMLASATQATGRGWGFGLHEALDQLGAVSGPLALAALLAHQVGYRAAFALLLIPATIAIVILLTARRLYPDPGTLEIKKVELAADRFPKNYWIYLLASALIAFGYIDFPLIAFHFGKSENIAASSIPLLYAVAMLSAALAALILGRIFDRIGLWANVIAVAIGALYAPLVFYGGFDAALAGMILWGIGMGVQDSILRAYIAEIVAPERRGRAYGLFGAVYGVAWFTGSATMGILYDRALPLVVILAIVSEIAAALVLAALARSDKPAAQA